MHEMQKLNKDTRRKIHGISKTRRRLRIVTILSRFLDCDNDKQRSQISQKIATLFVVLTCTIKKEHMNQNQRIVKNNQEMTRSSNQTLFNPKT